MGREKLCNASLGDEHGEVRAMLETNEIVLRDGIAAKLPLSTLRSMRVREDRFEAHTNRGLLSLALGATEAAAWLARINDPPSLPRKLGVERGTPVHVVDDHPEPRGVLSAAGASFVALEQATLVFVVVESETQLAALARLAAMRPASAHLWVLRPKGKHAAIKESVIIASLKAQGLAPSKTAAWSDAYAADRYGVARR